MIENTRAGDVAFDVGAAAGIVVPAKDGDIPLATIDAIIRMTGDRFPGDVRLEVSTDPEYPERPNFVFHVRQQPRRPSQPGRIFKMVLRGTMLESMPLISVG